MMEDALAPDKLPRSFSGTTVPLIDRLFTWSIILVRKRPTSSMVEQMTLNHLVQGSSPWSVTKDNSCLRVVFILSDRLYLALNLLQMCVYYDML